MEKTVKVRRSQIERLPIGATGVSIHIMAAMQLMDEAGEMQIPDATLADISNMGAGLSPISARSWSAHASPGSQSSRGCAFIDPVVD
jgi:hypothetical protein